MNDRVDRTLTTIAHLGLALAGIGTLGKLIITIGGTP